MEGVVKGGYPVDISSQSTADLSGIGLPEDGYSGASVDSGLNSAAVAQLEATVLDTTDFNPSITDVIRPMEMAELVDILPALSLIEEENPGAPSTPSVMDILENFGLGIGEENAHFVFEIDNRRGSKANPESETHCEGIVLNGAGVTPCCATVNGSESDMPFSGRASPRDDRQTMEAPSKGASLPVRNLVEWDRPSTSSS